MISYVVPIRCMARCAPGAHAELAGYLAWVAERAEVLVVDGSDATIVGLHRAAFGRAGAHLRIDDDLASANGKVDGVQTGVRHASHGSVVLADDDVRYDDTGLRTIEALLEEADVVVPQNAFVRPTPWHARWDGARSLVNRAVGMDYPGTLGIRRSTFLGMGGYDGDVLFENLELTRTVRAHGGRVLLAPDVIVPRRPPTLRAFLDQRIRQAYDDLAQPPKLAASMLILPAAGLCTARRRWGALLGGAAAAVALAEIGRRRGPADAFPASTSLFAPAWALERGMCAWIAVGARLIRGGIPYRGTVIRRAATPTRVLRRRLVAPTADQGG